MKTREVIATVLLAAVWRNPYVSAGVDMRDARNTRGHAVRYENFGARADGKTDDISAISQAHAFANQNGLPVQADDNATYYIGGQDNTVVIQTDTDFGGAHFIIDDRNVKNIRSHVFAVRSALKPVQMEGIASLKSGQRKVRTALSRRCVVCVTDSTTKRYIRRGLNRSSGTSQSDVFLVNANGNVDVSTPILWDFHRVTHIVAYPIDQAPLRITGGRFTTIANTAEPKYTYYKRGIAISRSNVVIQGLKHRIVGETDHGAPYGGFINIANCANVTVRDTTLNGHRIYRTIGSAGKSVCMGSYDISVSHALNVSFVNCRQFDDIKDRTRWGIMASNYSKNLLYERCVLSRFDAHEGVANATILDSTLGHMGINAIGSGKLIVKNSTVYAGSFINLRSDYGSTWQGEFVIQNCTFVPACGRPVSASLIGGSNDGQHDFGYTCYMPERITIDGLHIDDSRNPEGYRGPTIFADFNPRFTDATYEERYPYVRTREVVLNDVSTASGKPLRTSENPFIFKDLLVRHKGTVHKPTGGALQ